MGHHPDASDPSSAVARRFKIRVSAKQALEKHHAKELLRRAVSARSRVLEEIRVGEIIFLPGLPDGQSTEGPVHAR